MRTIEGKITFYALIDRPSFPRFHIITYSVNLVIVKLCLKIHFFYILCELFFRAIKKIDTTAFAIRVYIALFKKIPHGPAYRSR